MDEDDLDSWYEEQKEKLAENYQNMVKKADQIKDIKRRSKAHEKLKLNFDRDIRSLHKTFEEKNKRLVAQNLRKHFKSEKSKRLKQKLFGPLQRYLERFRKKE